MRRVRRGRFQADNESPMNYLSNLADAMLVLAVGMMLALIVHWNVDISTSGGSMSDSGVSYAAEGEGGNAAINRDEALPFTPDQLEPINEQDAPENGEEGMKKMGEVYYDEATGQYYIIENNASGDAGTAE